MSLSTCLHLVISREFTSQAAEGIRHKICISAYILETLFLSRDYYFELMFNRTTPTQATAAGRKNTNVHHTDSRTNVAVG